MDTFKCESCGSTNIITKNNQPICAYCQSNLIKKESVPSQKSSRFIIIIAVLLVVSTLIYSSIKNENPQAIKQNSVVQKPSKQAPSQQSPTQSDDLSDLSKLAPSKLDDIHVSQRHQAFTPFLPKEKFQIRFNNNYYKHNSIYPAYVELDDHGYRRVLEIPYEPKFYWSVASGRLFSNFQREHIRQIMNGKKLLSMSIETKHGIDLYTGTWINETMFERESKKLQAYGITPPQLKFKPSITPSKVTTTQMRVSLITANTQDADTKGRIFLSINSDDKQKYLLDTPQHNDHTLGSSDAYDISIDYPIEAIKNITLSIEGVDAWKMEQFTLQFIHKKNYSNTYILNSNQWFSQEDHDIKKLGAVPSYSFEFNPKLYSKDNAPTIYLPSP